MQKGWRRLTVWTCMTTMVCAGSDGSFAAADDSIWTTSSFLDFVDGTFSDGGVNTYVAADGTIRLINLWDLNSDGNIDVVLPNDHDHNERVDLFIYWGKEGFNETRRSQLPTDGGQAAQITDLNHDGYLDLIVANDSNATTTNLNSYIYWGSEKGFDAARRSELPTRGAQAVAVGDLNGDRHPDIVFANSGLGYHTTVDHFHQSYIYWGSPQGYSVQQRSTLGTVNARDVEVADLDQDGFPEVVFANYGNTVADSGATVYWGNAEGEFSDSQSTSLHGERSSSVVLADLNRNGIPEIILANHSRLKDRELGMYDIVDTFAIYSFVYWGNRVGEKVIYSAQTKTALPTVGASDVASGDLNGDGWEDIVFSNGSGRASYIYWGNSDGMYSHRRTAIATSKASHCAVEDLDSDGYPDLIFANHDDGSSNKTNSYIYWAMAKI